MSIEAHILNDVPVRNVNEKIKDLQELFNELTYSHLPVENNGIYLGCISENDVRCFEPEKAIEDYQYALEGFYARNNDYWLDILEAFAQNQSNILPVLDEENKYLGYVELNEIISLFNDTPFFSEKGGILVIEKSFKDYSFSEVSQIVESNNAHLLGAFLSKIEDDMAQVTVKVNATALNGIIQSFRRYGYNILSDHQEDVFNKNLKDRSQYLDKYLNI